MTPQGVLIVAFWLVGLRLLGKARDGLPWREQGDAAGGQEGSRSGDDGADRGDRQQRGTGRTILVFAVAAVVTLAAGVVLERSGEAIAAGIGMSGLLFGATVLAAATSLPELSTGLAAVRLGDDQLAVSDIFGGNAFLPVLFLVATLLSDEAVLPRAQASDVFLTALGVLLTTVYIAGLVFRPRRRIARLGIDSLTVVVLYLVGIAGLVAVAHG